MSAVTNCEGRGGRVSARPLGSAFLKWLLGIQSLYISLISMVDPDGETETLKGRTSTHQTAQSGGWTPGNLVLSPSIPAHCFSPQGPFPYLQP